MLLVIHGYGTLHGFWPVEELVEWWVGLLGVVKSCGGGRLFAWNFGVTTVSCTYGGREKG
jgi:hypothetical protein